MPTYYPFFLTDPIGKEIPGVVGMTAGNIAININALSTSAGWPWLTVNGKIGIGFNSLSTSDTYDPNAPDLATSGKVGIGYDFVNQPQASSYDYAGAPALSVVGKAIIGPDLRKDKGYAVGSAPTLSVNGTVAIGEPPEYVPDPTERLRVNGDINVPEGDINVSKGNMEVSVGHANVGDYLTVKGYANVGGDLNVDGNAGVKLRLTVGHDSRFSRLVYISDSTQQQQQTGVFINTTLQGGTYGSAPNRPDVTYPVFAVINGLMGQVQHDADLATLQLAPEEVVNEAMHSKSGFEGHYILMGDLKGLLKASLPSLPGPCNDAYGMRMSWNSDFLMLNLVDIDAHVETTPGKGKKGQPTQTYFPSRRDAVLAWGDKRENYFRIRYVGEEVNIFQRDASKSPVAAGKVPVDPEKKTKLGKSRQRVYDKARRRLLGALADWSGQKLDKSDWQDAWPGYRDIVVVDPDGSVVVNGAIYAMRAMKTSDGRLKEAIEPIPSARNLALALRGVKFAWKGGPPDHGALEGEPREYGMIAQEVEKLCPEAVSKDSDGILAIDYDQIVPILLEAIKEQEHVISAQHSRLAKLEQTVEHLAEATSMGRKKVTAEPRKKAPAPPRPPAKRSAAPRTGRAARGPRQ